MFWGISKVLGGFVFEVLVVVIYGVVIGSSIIIVLDILG